MKVYIGPYRNNHFSCRFYDKFCEKKYGRDKYWNMKEEEFDRIDRFLERIEDFCQSVLNLTINIITSKQKRKIDIRIDKYDTWSMDHTLALIILPMLKQLREDKHGSPWVDEEDVPENLRVSQARRDDSTIEDWDKDNTLHERWSWVLDEMIYAFESQVDEEWDDQFETGVRDLKHNLIEDENGKQFSIQEGPNHTFKIDQEAKDAAWERRKNGLILFGKYYQGLWD